MKATMIGLYVKDKYIVGYRVMDADKTAFVDWTAKQVATAIKNGGYISNLFLNSKGMVEVAGDARKYPIVNYTKNQECRLVLGKIEEYIYLVSDWQANTNVVTAEELQKLHEEKRTANIKQKRVDGRPRFEFIRGETYDLKSQEPKKVEVPAILPVRPAIVKSNDGKGYVIDNGVVRSDGKAVAVIQIPREAKEIAVRGFADNAALRKIVFNEGLKRIGDNAFENCENLVVAAIPTTVEYIGDFAFDSCEKLEDVGTLAKVEYIGNGAFGSTSIKEAVVNAEYIGDAAFAGCDKLTRFLGGINIKKIGEAAISDCKALESISFVNTKLEVIPKSMCQNCQRIVTAKLPESIKVIEAQAFAKCNKLKTVNMPVMLTEIGDKAFAMCEALVSITMYDSLKEIGTLAFYGCKLITIDLGGKVKNIGRGAFAGVNVETTRIIGVPKSIKEEIANQKSHIYDTPTRR